jgi:hypothetical protein
VRRLCCIGAESMHSHFRTLARHGAGPFLHLSPSFFAQWSDCQCWGFRYGCQTGRGS